MDTFCCSPTKPYSTFRSCLPVELSTANAVERTETFSPAVDRQKPSTMQRRPKGPFESPASLDEPRGLSLNRWHIVHRGIRFAAISGRITDPVFQGHYALAIHLLRR